MATVMQASRVMEISTPLGSDVLLFHRMHAREELGRLSELEIDLLSPRGDVKHTDILGKNVTVKLELGQGERFFNGFVVRFAHIGTRGRYHVYHASVRPWLWFLTRMSDCRIFQKMTAPDIIRKVFSDHGFSDVKYALSGTYRQREYCVQYRETDFAFVSRLMEEEGIYYYFSHTNGRHIMTITDSCSGHDAFPGHADIPYIPQDRVRPDQEAITDWIVSHEVQSASYQLWDYDFEGPMVRRQGEGKNERVSGLSKLAMYDYPGGFTKSSDGNHYAKTRLEELHSQFEVIEGATNCRGLATGSLIKVKGHPRVDPGLEYLIVSATHELQFGEYEAMQGSGSSYSCNFNAISSKEPFRPQRLTHKPVVQGPQTAVVVGPAGDEIYTDKYGRVKVQFHWDREGKKNQDSSCWIRVSQNWAGKRWGAIFLPRIGQEVIVDFLEGDPDQPIITGRVYNGDAMPPYSLPDEMTKSTIKSLSSKGGGGFNEIRFEDKKGSEQLFFHAERNEDNRVKKDSLEWIGQDRHLIVVRDQMEKVDGDKHLSVKGDQNEKVDGTVSLKAAQDLEQKIGMKHALDAGQEIHLKAGMNVVIESGVTLTLKVGGNFININPGGIFIQGIMVMINSGGSAGTGAGCSPGAAKPPQEADKADPGEKTQTSASPEQKGKLTLDSQVHKPTSLSSSQSAQTTALKEAAKSGVPFCEKCEEAKRAQQAQSQQPH